MSIEYNKRVTTRVDNMIFGLYSVGDGLVRILSLGFLVSSFQLDRARKTARKHILKGESK